MGKHAELVKESLDKVRRNAHGVGGAWARQHLEAWSAHRLQDSQRVKRPIVAMILACADYADAHEKRFESGIGEDGVLGLEWESMVKAVRGLLNGELGGLDGGTLDSLLCRMLEAEGFEA